MTSSTVPNDIEEALASLWRLPPMSPSALFKSTQFEQLRHMFTACYSQLLTPTEN